MQYRSQVHYDVVVVGAGAAGVAAACSAARSGQRVALIEKHSHVGGLATTAYVGTICGLYAQSSASTTYAGQFTNEFRQRLEYRSGRSVKSLDGVLHFLPYDPWEFEQVCEELLSEAQVDRFYHSHCMDVREVDESADAYTRTRRIQSLVVDVAGDPSEFVAKSFVDATGEGVLSMHAKLRTASSYQAPGYVISFHSLSPASDGKTEQEMSRSVLSTLLRAEQDGRIAKGTSRFTVVPGSFHRRQLSLKLAFPHVRLGEFNELTTLERFGRQACLQNAKVLCAENEFFHSAEIRFLASHVGVRSGRRGEGLYVLSGEDVVRCRHQDSFVAFGLWPLEEWNQGRKACVTLLQALDKQEACYAIPAEALCSATYQNLYFCGRGISADEKALSSARVIGTSLATGSAAGSLAVGNLRGESLAQSVARIQGLERFEKMRYLGND